MTQKRNTPLIVRQTVSLATANSLRERILRGDFAQGQPLLQDVLAAEYGVSRIPLREALRQLESEGLVNSIPHRGYLVTVLSLEEALEISEIRALLECDVIAHAIPKMTQDHFNRAQQKLDDMRELCREDVDGREHSELNWEFHSILYEASNRQRSLKLISSLHHSSDRLVRTKAASTIGFDRIYRDHCELLELCRQRNVPEAVKFLKKHILVAAEVLKQNESQPST